MKKSTYTYQYFVSFAHPGGFGNIEIFRNSKITSPNHLIDVEKAIFDVNKKRFKENNVVILNYILLKKITNSN